MEEVRAEDAAAAAAAAASEAALTAAEDLTAVSEWDRAVRTDPITEGECSDADTTEAAEAA